MAIPMTRSLLLGSAFTVLSLALHLAPIWVTMLNRGHRAWDGRPLGQDYISHVIEEHRAGPDMSFRRRPLTTWCIDALSSSGLTPKAAFMAWGFGLFLLSGLLIHRLALHHGTAPPHALFAQAAFHLSPTVLCAWFEPMYTYDEPLQYAAFLLGWHAVLKGRTGAAIAALTVALIAHETTLFLLPVIAMQPDRSRRARWLTAAMPVALFLLFLGILLPAAGLTAPAAADATDRLGTIAFNFSTPAMARETIGYLLMTLLLPSALLWRSRGRRTRSPQALRAFWIALALNTLAVLVAAKAREARVLALPLLLGWPLLGSAIAEELSLLQATRWTPWRMLALIPGTAAAYALARFAFPLSTNVQGDNLWHELLAVQLAATVLLIWSGRSGSRPLAAQLEVAA